MQEILVILILITLAALLLVLWRLSQLNKPQQNTGLDLLQQQVLRLNEQLDQKLADTNKTLNEQLKFTSSQSQQQFNMSQKQLQEISMASQELIRNVTEKLVKLEETNTQIKGFAGQLQSLENILKNPKQRGVLGEYFLETILKNVLPPRSYQMQYKFKNGEIVDSVIFVKDKIIPVDSKFSLENYNKILQADNELDRENLQKMFKQDLKKRIDETSKYIRPEEGTMKFAFMFIPAEGIYYDLLINQVGVIKANTNDLIEYAFAEKSVIIVSPTSFLAYLQTVLQGLRALEVEEKAVEIIKSVDKLRNHLKAYEEHQLKLGRNLSTVVNAYNDSTKEFSKIDKDVLRITGATEGIQSEQILIDKPGSD